MTRSSCTRLRLPMGDLKSVWFRRIGSLHPYQLTMDLLVRTRSRDALHALPACLRDRHATVEEQLYEDPDRW